MVDARADVPGFDAVGLRADNPGPLTLRGTNTWVLGRDPAWVVDPGPALPVHLDAVAAEVAARGGAGGIALTHGHADHSEGALALRERLGGGVPVAAMGWPGATERLADGVGFGPLEVLALPGHADDLVVLLWGQLCCSGDAVLGEGSVFVAGDMAGYLAGLQRLRERTPAVICPGHGPLVSDPAATLTTYREHRLDRERRLLAALDAGARSDAELLHAAWADAPPALRLPAALTMHAHLRKLGAEGRLPAGVQARPAGELPAV